MRLNALLPRQCITCPAPPTCNCSANQDCVLINRDCTNCAKASCVDRQTASTSSSGGVSKGAVAGAVVGSIIFLALAVCLYLWYRRTTRIRKALAAAKDAKDVPAPAASVLNRPDPNEKPSPNPSVIDVPTSLDPPYVFSRDGNPFDDTNSIQTAGTGGTNVIPIALVSPEHQGQSIRSGESVPSINTGPIRPARSPEDNLNLDHVNVSHDNLRPGNNYEGSTISGISAVSSNRQSYMSGMTYASDFLNEAPMIMTPTKGPIRQVMGVAKPEVINAGTLSSGSNDSLKPPPSYTRATNKSPLAASSFGPNDVLKEGDEREGTNPFDDKHSSTNAEYSLSPPHTANTVQTTRQDRDSNASGWTPEGPTLPWAKSDDASRPSSMSTQAGSVIDIASATRVNVGLMTPGTASTAPRTPFRTTIGRLISPTGTATAATAGSLQEQQARALAHAQAQAQAQGLDKPRPISGSSAISATSTRADSILESFPFVPPSPISNRPIRSPPVSPLAQQTFSAGSSSPLGQHTFVVAPPSPLSNTGFNSQGGSTEGGLPAPPNRKTLGMSTASQLSTASTGLGSFPFQIDSGSDRPESLQPPVPFNRTRASLDTLALTSDLSSYPLGFDRDSTVPPPRQGPQGKF
ncbi:hypothetical protein DFP72DRAFT_876437 [Ephemerocybe angulata]|uniref:Membrane anchor Opy2 N-terminal domain-containing protein n=1 Tax=Ephemerocybe angulata TaxID=980116 RepID=A0A8H6IE21_9AGAR|nr:hypothetical protein DFP72DRAFT_876437 [Tulosesus angulatus]